MTETHILTIARELNLQTPQVAATARLFAEGATGTFFDLFFLLSGVLSLAAILFLPVIGRARPRPPDDLPL